MDIIQNMVYKCLVGSRAYGTNISESDYDHKGIYIQPASDILGFKYQPQIEVGKDECYYEIKRFIELAMSANPTILEMLFIEEDSIILQDECLKLLFENRHRFITKKCFDSFGGYAVAQIKKARGLDKKINWEKEKIERKTPLDFCYFRNAGYVSVPLRKYLEEEELHQDLCGLSAINHMPNCYNLFYDYNSHFGKLANREYKPYGFKGIQFEDSNHIRLSSIPKECDSPIGLVYYNKDAYSIHCKEFNEYNQWLKNSNPVRRIETQVHGQKIDGKNLLHCVRLIDCCLEIATTGSFSVRRPNADYLLKIRKGQINLETIVEESEEKLILLNELKKSSTLPDNMNLEFAHEIINKIRNGF